MGLFKKLMSKIFPPVYAQAPPDAWKPGQSNAGGVAVQPAPATATAPRQGPVDIAAILDGMAASSSQKLDWKHSIVDLMKLVGMDSSLAERKELAAELKYTGDTNDSATMNKWLHKEVMRKLSENGGKVPADLLD